MNFKSLKRTALSSALIGLMFTPVLSHAFVVETIQVEGANRIGFETINSYLPFAKGTTLSSSMVQKTIQSLYKTGFFDEVSLYQKDNGVLVIKVVERATLAEIEMEGNKLIETDALKEALDGLGIKTGRIYNQVEMDRVIVDLKRRYHNFGYYAAEVEIISTELPRNRVALKIKIVENDPATIGKIALVGNKVYSDERLKSLIQMSDKSAAFGDGDKYSKPKLEADIETLRSYYMDRGYAEYKVRSSQVSLSTDKSKVFTTINMTEGEQYTISTINFAGELIVERKVLEALLTIKESAVFSRSAIVASVNAIRDRLSEEGYAFAEVEPDTVLDKTNRTVALLFKVEPKDRVYIRRVEVEGNTRTRDHVIRREMRQLESAPYSLKDVRNSKARLNRLGYFKSADIETKRVSKDEVDLVVKVEEQATGSFSAGVGYSQLDGVSFNLGVSERNFVGSGNKLDFSVATSAARKTADIGITNPYFTDDGVSLGGGFYLSEIDAEELEIADYTTNNKGIRLSLGYPLSEVSNLSYGLKLDSQELVCSNTFSFCNDYAAINGTDTTAAIYSMGWTRDTKNAFYFPSDGQVTSLSMQAVVPGTSDAAYYKLFADEKFYYPLTRNLTLNLRAGIAYGEAYGDTEELPFYERFYAGGIGSVRGFEPNSLGDLYDLTANGSDRPRGGSTRVISTAALVFPMPLIEDSSNLRLSVFFDAGNVFNTFDQIDLGELRSSVGLGFSWITPVGPLSFSFAQPVAYEKSDDTQTFQFNLGMAL
ncbi:outer membrane protein assembly factor BamA [Thiomicrorhabdus aquaedulcis]|uniref:outer membrane protein assembly factor BamA n=1 Tax=Thiomicrorhabdus aquaedulcis TaxID=2211106 RepID=UPI001E38E8EE|nr:outer membrane protein assembly factor BamA [Thiomicrorhabdus aquaedulcis]